MDLRRRWQQLLERLGVQQETIVVLGMCISPRCGYCNRRFQENEIVMLSVALRAGLHMHCQVEYELGRKKSPPIDRAALSQNQKT